MTLWLRMRQFVASAWRSTLAIALELNRALTQAERDAEARERDRSESVFQTREF